MKIAVRIVLAAALVSFGVVACNENDLPPSSTYASLNGTVVDSTSHQPIVGATVVVDSVLTATTDSNGAFHFDKIPSGIVDYVVHASGYGDVNATGNADAGKPLTLNVVMGQPQTP